MNQKYSSSFVLIFIASIFFVPSSQSSAQVELKILRDGRTTKRTGKILQWSGYQILLQANGRERKIDSRDVIDLKTDWPSDLEEARRAVTQHDYSTATRKYELAILQDERLWVRQTIWAELVELCDAQENSVESIRYFLKIATQDTDTRFFHLIPLSWSTSGLKTPPENMTKPWLQAESKIVQLLAASWRLSGTGRTEAIDKLQSLA
ncbi:MAG: hypothetical protein AAGA30_01940, partial [Planctomycetota bacterium]